MLKGEIELCLCIGMAYYTSRSSSGDSLGPWLFLIMINDLSVTNTNIWKYLDDFTLVQCVEKNGTRKFW